VISHSRERYGHRHAVAYAWLVGPDDVHAHYLRDLGFLLREAGEDAKRRAQRPWRSKNRQWESGRQFAYMEVLSLMQQQAESFELPLSDLGLEGFDAERDLL
jgi:hypothetical protein